MLYFFVSLSITQRRAKLADTNDGAGAASPNSTRQVPH